MSRAEELREAGATVLGDRSGGTGDRLAPTPFIKWPSTTPPTAWVEGSLTEVWEGKFGDNATIIVTGCSEGLTAAAGRGPEAVIYPVEGIVGGKVNVGLSSATLKDRVTEGHVGEVLHFEFLGWVEPANGGNHYRNFEIQVVPEEMRRFVVEEERFVVHGDRVLDLDVTEDEGPVTVADAIDDELPF